MSLFLVRIYKWQDVRDSSNRISGMEKDTGRQFILNTNRISDLKACTVVANPLIHSSFYYSDNPANPREGLSYLEVDHTVAEIAVHFNDVPASQAITLSIVPYNSPYKGNPVFPFRTPVDTTIGIWSIAYVDRYNPLPNDYVWVAYYKGAFKRMEVLCNLDYGYPTLTSTTTGPQGQHENQLR
jgi:hypothetical protein